LARRSSQSVERGWHSVCKPGECCATHQQDRENQEHAGGPANRWMAVVDNSCTNEAPKRKWNGKKYRCSHTHRRDNQRSAERQYQHKSCEHERKWIRETFMPRP
jgi:hypothetical protein